MPEFDSLHVTLVATRNPLNIGAAARAVSNFGFSKLRLVNVWEPSYREAKSAVGAAALLAASEEFKSLSEAVSDCSLIVGTTAAHHRELEHPIFDLETAATRIRKHLKTGKAALLFGSEKVGLSNQDLSHCHWLLNIPARQEHLSLNLGQAVAVCLYQLRMAVLEKSLVSVDGMTQSLAPAQDLERITALLVETLLHSQYVKPGAESSIEEKVRMLVRRLALTSNDASLLLGMMRQILWRLGSGAE
jgi:TrmH family RNA methyltransferase